MNADPSIFVFGHFADPEHLAQEARRRLAGLFHGYRMEPSDPAPGEPVCLRFSSGVDLAIDRVVVFDPDHSGGPEEGVVVGATHSGVAWDELAWRYVDLWEAVLPGAPAGSRILYSAAGYSALRGERYFADTVPGQQATVFGYDVDTLTPPDWIHDAVIYQVFVDRFFATNMPWGRRLRDPEEIYGGTLDGVAAKLDHIQELGANVIWLTPVFESETSHGYDALDYERIAERFGGEQALRDVVAGAHERGIRVLLDLAVNHCSWHNPRFVDARTNERSPYRDWFVFTHWPDAYECFFGVRELPHLNGDNPEVVAYMSWVASRYLVDFKVDGFRLDYALGPSLLFWTQFRAATKGARTDSFTVGEATTGAAELHKFVGRLDGCLDFLLLQAFRQFFADESLDAPAFHATISTHKGFFPPSFVLPTFLDNHDMNRFLWAVGGDVRRLMLAALCQMTLPQPPIVYYGTEVGLSQDAPTSEIGFAASRLPMIWDAPIDNELLSFYKTLIRARHDYPSLRYGAREALIARDRVYVYSCRHRSEGAVVALNASSTLQDIAHGAMVGKDLLSGEDVRGSLTLAPYTGALVLTTT